MPTPEPLILTHDTLPGVTTITLNRPGKRNALNIELIAELISVLENLTSDTRVIIIRGNGPVFCAGLDLTEGLDEEKAHESAQHVAKLLHTLSTMPQVTIASIHGAAIAGGAGVMSACDLAVAAEGTLIGYPEVRRGLVAGLVMHYLLCQVGQRAARELLLLGDNIDAQEAFRIGLISRVVASDRVAETSLKMAQRALKGGPGSIAHTKRMIDELTHPTIRQAIDLALDHHVEARGSAEAKEGILAFAERRKPKWDMAKEEEEVS